MSLAYCSKCFIRIDQCECEEEGEPIFGEIRLSLAQYRKQVFKKIREQVIGEKEKQYPSGYNREAIIIRNNHREDQLKKLEALEKETR